jgi:hypothetical protein
MTNNEQLVQVFVAHPADTAEPLFATARFWSGVSPNQAVNGRPKRI